MTICAAVDVGLDDRHGAVVEVAGVGVIGGAAEQFDVEGALLAIFQAETVDELGALNNADAKVIEGGVVIDIRGLGDQAVVGNHENAGIMSLLENIRHGRAINGGDDEHVGALGDHVFDLGQLVVDVIVSKLQVGFVAQGFEGFDHALAIRNPAGRGLGRHGNTNHFGASSGSRSFSCGGGSVRLRRQVRKQRPLRQPCKGLKS